MSEDGCEIHWIPGGHFFVEHNRALVLEKVNAAIARTVQAARFARIVA